jgi:Tfp pilus assembly protein PilN
MSESITVSELDSLPSDYRNRVSSSRSHSWLAIALIVYAAFTGGLLAYQQIAERSLGARSAIVQPRYADAQQKNQRFVELQAEVTKANDLADYCAYLEHPWPRTQILSTLIARLSPGVYLTEVDLARERLPARELAEVSSPPATTGSHDPQKKQDSPPTAREELQRLRREVDCTRIVLHVRGVTGDPAALHACLATLTQSRLFARAQLESMNAYRRDDMPHGTAFDLRLELLPGYGQAGGPAAPPSEHLAQQP